MTQKIFSRIIFAALAAALILPQIIFAQTAEEAALDNNSNYPRLSQWETQALLKDSLPQALTDQWITDFTGANSNRFYMAVPLTLRSFINQNFFHYLLSDVPLDAAKVIVTQGIEIGRIILADDYNAALVKMLEKFEKDSVQAAINYAKSELFKYQIKLSTGAFETQYWSEKGNEKVLIQYVVVYKAIDDSNADVSIRIYSTASINPPKSGLSFGGTTGVIHNLNPGEQIPPFTATFSGVVQKNQYGGISYSWIGQPQVDISFPADVPDLGLRPKSWWERNVADPIKNFFNDPMKSLGDIFGAQLLPIAINPAADQAGTAWQDEILPTSSEEASIGAPAATEDKDARQTANDARQATDSARQNDSGATDARQQSGQTGTSATFGAPAATGQESDATQLSAEERRQALAKIAREVFRRQEKPQTEGEDQGLRIILLTIIQELAKNSGQTGQAVDGANGGEEDGSNSEEDAAPDDNDSGGAAEDDSGSGETSAAKSAPAAAYCDYQSGQAARSNQIVLNEVAWMGTAAGANHEWIELKNLTSQTINLADWQLQDKDRQIKIVFGATNQIAAGQLFLLERTSDDAVPGIKASLIYTGALGNNNEALYLFGPDCQLQDKVEASPGWPAGSDSLKRTMEREAGLGWHTYSGSGQNNILGTPKAANGPAAAQPPSGGGTGGGGGGGTATNSSSTQDQNTTSSQQAPSNIAEPAAISHLIISEVQPDGESGQEYVELYNPIDQEIALCPGAAGTSTAFYFSYYSASKEWNDPVHNRSFCDSPAGENAVIPAKGYYLIGFNGWPETESDWPMYSSNTLSNSEGAIAIFSDNPKNATGTADEIAAEINAIKLDALGWKQGPGSSEPRVKEANAATVPPAAGRVLGRLWHNASRKYQDTDDNAQDFAAQNPSPKDSLSFAPEAVIDLAVQNYPGQKNAAKLSWSAPNDLDTLPGQLDYQIFFVRNQEAAAESLKEIETETTPIIAKQGEQATAIIPDLYYDSNYYFWVQAVDEEDNASPLSNTSSVFAIAAADHPWPMAKHDAGQTNQGGFGGPAGDQAAAAFADLSGDLRSPPVIDENGAVYFFGSIGGQSGLYAFDAAGQKKWSFAVSNPGQIPALTSDGTIYFFAPFGVGALSPAGQLKWSENFNAIYTKNPLAGSDGRLYFVAQNETQANPHLLGLADGGDRAVRSIDHDLAAELEAGETAFSVSGLALDSQDNIYLALNQKLVKFDSSGQKIGERVFAPEYASSYGSPQDKIVSMRSPSIFNDAVIAVAAGGYCFKEATSSYQPEYDTCEEMVYSVDSADFNSENWKKPIGPNYRAEAMGKEFYYSVRTPNHWSNGGYLDLYAIDLAEGNRVWSKNWTEGGMPAMIYPVLADSEGRAYFARGSAALGYDLNQTLDSDPDHGLIFSGAAANPQCNDGGGALGPAGLYVPALNQLNLIPAP
jgi:hypothetical protein